MLQKRIDIDSLELVKISSIEDTVVRFKKIVERLQQELEFNQNHYLLVENYVEKYLPITI